MWMLDELGVEYEQVPFGVPSLLGPLVPREEIVRLNPSGKVPVLVDGDLVLSESYAINLHLAMAYESELTPRSEPEWARTLQWTAWVATEIENDLGKALVVRRSGALGGLDEAQRSEDSLIRWGVSSRLETLERALTRSECLLGDRFTVADLNVASMLALAGPSGIDLAPHSELRRWLAACLARPAARSTWDKVTADARAFGFVGDLRVPEDAS
jgi:glutathione S-transferase